jgi:cellulose synthase/poly-beta-1,6-N-acetylglucosamine synthase-like glycosyltransferase
MYSVLLTSYMEPHTVGTAITALLRQMPPDAELLAIAPDDQTIAVITALMLTEPRLRLVRDERQGKPAALNLGLAAAHHAVVVLTDGDVFVEDGALAALLLPLDAAAVGAVTGRPVSVSPRDTMLGFWSHLLVEAAHETRLRRHARGEFLVCSGYLFAYRRALVPAIPPDALAEDAVISHRIAEQGFRIAYAPDARVQVRYPATYADWLRQKVRSAGGYAQPYITQSPVQMRSARLEVRDGTGFALRYPRTWRERLWTLALFAARAHLWALVFWQVRVRRVPLVRLWQRVASTK